VNRSESSDDSSVSGNVPKIGSLGWIKSAGRDDELESNEVYVHIRIGYKTILLAFVLFDVFGFVIKTLFQ